MKTSEHVGCRYRQRVRLARCEEAVAAWNPQLSEIKKTAGANEIFDGSQIPNEIQDLMTVSTSTLKANPNLGKALVGACYEVMGIMAKGDAQSKEAIAEMAKLSGTTVENYEAQLKTTPSSITSADAVHYSTGADIVKHEDAVRQFSFSKGPVRPQRALGRRHRHRIPRRQGAERRPT